MHFILFPRKSPCIYTIMEIMFLELKRRVIGYQRANFRCRSVAYASTNVSDLLLTMTMPQCAAFSSKHGRDNKQYNASGVVIIFHKFPVNKSVLLKQWLHSRRPGAVGGRSCISKVRCSEITRFYVPKVLCSEGFVPKKIEGSIFRRFYIPKALCSEKLEGSMFRNLRLCTPLRLHGVSVRRLTWWMDICIRD